MGTSHPLAGPREDAHGVKLTDPFLELLHYPLKRSKYAVDFERKFVLSTELLKQLQAVSEKAKKSHPLSHYINNEEDVQDEMVKEILVTIDPTLSALSRYVGVAYWANVVRKVAWSKLAIKLYWRGSCYFVSCCAFIFACHSFYDIKTKCQPWELNRLWPKQDWMEVGTYPMGILARETNIDGLLDMGTRLRNSQMITAVLAWYQVVTLRSSYSQRCHFLRSSRGITGP
ncbi:hypothetical protein BBJ28_00021199 [Nothophytophthora sp. Chile5]|nr:hypothetical protein BBJ28_00021199 [Nothophytophthora sp. Chile5]